MSKTILPALALAFATTSFFTACQKTESGPWADFKKCATNACVKEAVAVKDAFLKDPKMLLGQFHETYSKGDDHVIGWLYILRDSVLFSEKYGTTEQRMAMQQAIVAAAKPFEKDSKLGEMARSVLENIEDLAILAETEDGPEAEVDYAVLTGTYGYDLGENGNGTIKVAVEDAETIRFDLSVTKGGPGHNMGMMEGKAKRTGMNQYEAKTTEFKGTCRLQFTFHGDSLVLKTLEGTDATCGFGMGVVADHNYKREGYDDPFLSKKDAATAKNLLGNWVSTTDPKNEISLKNGRYVETNNGEKMLDLPFNFHPKCPKGCNPVATGPCFVVSGQDDICYALVKADGKSLEFSMIGGKGNTLVYKKK